ncbi:MAG: helix-turn-helix domain-containing protein [Coriobacteriia bacterium]|nr:helix-turn-helix domain-containing protein [Coriobacteriia bacterium]
MVAETTPIEALPSYLTPTDIAKLLRKSPRTVTRWLTSGEIPEAIYINGRWTVPKEALLVFLDKHSGTSPFHN